MGMLGVMLLAAVGLGCLALLQSEKQVKKSRPRISCKPGLNFLPGHNGADASPALFGIVTQGQWGQWLFPWAKGKVIIS